MNSLQLAIFYQQHILGISDLNQSPSSDNIQSDLWLQGDNDRKEMLDRVSRMILDNYCTIAFNGEQLDNDELSMDQVQLYASEVLTLGLLYMEFSDAIREGDGPRTIR